MLNLSTQKRLFIMFLVVALIPLLTLGIISYDQSSKVVNGKLSNYNHFAGEKIKTQLDQILEDMYFSAAEIKQYLMDDTSVNLHNEVPRTYEDFKEVDNLQRLLQAHKKSNIRGIYIITSSGYYYGDYDFLMKEFKMQDIWKRTIRSGDSEIGIYQPNHLKDNQVDHVLGLIVPLKFSYGVLNNSYLLIETDIDDLYILMEVLEKDLQSRITIRNELGQALYHSKSEEADLVDDILTKENTNINNWEVEIRVPRDKFYQSSQVILKMVSIGILIAFILALILSYVFSTQFSKRIFKLKMAIDEVSKGIFDTKLLADGQKDEIGKLGGHFNRMVEKIKQLMEEVREKEATKREAEMKAIHYQINPHLLFNTLNTIQWKARMDGNVEIGKMLMHLIKVLEKNLDSTIELIPLKEELQALQHFFAIQEMRYGKNFTFTLKMDEQLEKGLIPRMTLQPMLENIFFHAFEDGEGTISLELSETLSYFRLVLKDNGKGIPQEKLEGLFTRPNEKKRGGVGLYNVRQKFSIHYGTDFHIDMDSVAGEGTTIKITWPKRWVDQDEQGSNKSVNSR
ncbi:two-component sensor histidine kinase [Neobacillus piezotolerans]|uniref:histidine kinase n=1 Tax=Neobacillus piezotolerans TaxID=2259171 RepID=A0A3D8GRJ8_9BACI|nr:histidine kinase [Neobacillus piezotolerans]RDU37104.1 two-component sensor histidine kinase [Neobacillus piezotolerans]